MAKNKETKAKFTKDTVPQDFTLSLVLVDALPVLFFGASAVLIGMIFKSTLFLIGAMLCLLGGAGKVLWKLIVVLAKKNIWFLFIQMRFLMPAGFLLMLISLAVDHAKVSFAGMARAFVSFPSILFFLAGIAGMVMMGVFAKKLDSGSLKANWIEQLTNGIAQLCIFLGLLFIYL